MRALAVVLIALAAPWQIAGQVPGTLFEDDFENGLAAWAFPQGQGYELLDSGDPQHGTVLSLETRDRITLALIRGSARWNDVRIEGEVLFPEDVHNYLGFIYRYSDSRGRTDFGSLYIKGNSSYIRVNPHHDLNVGRTLYEEFRTPLTEEAAIEIGAWQDFALEVVGGEAHLYVGDMGRPQITLPFYDADRGAFGFKPRNPGGAVWVDGLTVSAIEGFTYQGPPVPDHDYDTSALVVDWEVLGPLTRFHAEVETSPYDPNLAIQDGDALVRWRPHAPDPRGAVLTGRVTNYEGPRRVAYFHATVHSDRDQAVPLGLSTVDDLTMWVNGRFVGFLRRDSNAWWDFRTNADHTINRGRITLNAGANHVLVRVVGGTYATGGFFLSLTPDG